jgi:hypothetical protein
MILDILTALTIERINKFFSNIRENSRKRRIEKLQRILIDLKEKIEDVNHEILAHQNILQKFLIDSHLLIDNNIWMENRHEQLLIYIRDQLTFHGKTLKMPNIAFNELIKLKDRKYNDRKSHKARMALSRIEQFENHDCLEIVPLDYQANGPTYADPVLIKILLRKANNAHMFICFITDDRELRIRCSQFLRKKTKNYKVFSGDDLYSQILKLNEYISQSKQLNEQLEKIHLKNG